MEEDLVTAPAIEEFKALMQDPAARAAFAELKSSKAEGGTRRRYNHVLQAVAETPWAIRPHVLGLIVDVLTIRVEGGHFTPDELSARVEAARRRPTTESPRAGVAIVPITGVLVPKATMFTEMSGGTSMESFRQDFRAALAASDVGAVVLDIDSPGGMVDQIPEMATEIRESRGTKPIVAVANTEAASAAYYLGSQADEFVVTKSGKVGSIGVFAAHEDHSRELDEQGVTTTLISAGKFKTEGNPFEPLSDGARDHMQALVDEYYGMFVADVAKGRGVGVDEVRSGFGQGRIVGAREALATGMVDRIGSLEGEVRNLLRGSQGSEVAALGTDTGTTEEPARTLSARARRIRLMALEGERA